MGLPVIQGVIRRRILVNFRVDPRVMQVQLPSRFRPKLQQGHAIAGICLIRLEEVRPRLVPQFLGLSSENAAHRIAVRWQTEGTEKEGVFIPRRDTGSAMNHLAGADSSPESITALVSQYGRPPRASTSACSPTIAKYP